MLKFPKNVFQTFCRCFEYSTVTKIDPLSRAALSHFDQGEKPLRNVLRRALSVRGKYKRPASVVFGLPCFKSCTPLTVGSRKSEVLAEVGSRKSEVGSLEVRSPKSEVGSPSSASMAMAVASCFQLSCFVALIDMVFLELKCGLHSFVV